MKRVLIVTPHWIPTNAPDMQRARMSLPFYRENGWDPVILCVEPSGVDAPLEPELEFTVPRDVTVHRCRAFSRARTRWFGIGSIGLRCVWPLWRAGLEIIRRERIDLVFMTNTQFVTFAAARLWKRSCGVPYVIDVQDPWRTDYFERPGAPRPPGGRKYQFARFVAWALEEWSFSAASAAMSVSDDYLHTLRRRYPRLLTMPTETIPFGTTQLDFEVLARLASGPTLLQREPGSVHFVFTGTIGPVKPYALDVLFAGLKRYRESHPDRAQRIRFHFVGTRYVTSGDDQTEVLPFARRWGVEAQVDEIPYRLGYFDSLRWQQQSDVLLILGSSDLAYSPSKLYPYYLSGRPMLGLVFKNSLLHRLLNDLACATIIEISTSSQDDAASSRLETFFDTVLNGTADQRPQDRDRSAFERCYMADTLTARQCRLFDRAHEAYHASASVHGR